jgi:hypothetical protein
MRLRQIAPAIASLSIIAACGVFSSAAVALETNAPGWEASSHSYPTNLDPGGSGNVAIEVYNIGGAESSEGATLTDVLPAGLVGRTGEGWTCSGEAPDTCSRELPAIVSGEREEYLLPVTIASGALEGPASNTVTISGGGSATGAAASDSLTISTLPDRFGLRRIDGWESNANGTIDTQAGSHPFDLVFSFDMNTNGLGPSGEAHNMTVNAPPGIVGNATAFTQCPRERFDYEHCPVGSEVGTLKVTLGPGEVSFALPLYNMVPPPGEPAQFGFELLGNRVFLDATIRSNGDYGITMNVAHIPQREIVTASATLWGVPASPSHDARRQCFTPGGTEYYGCASPAGEVPFLTLPTACRGPETFSATVNSWQNESETGEAHSETHDQQGNPVGLSGCEHLGFDPSLTTAPDTSDAETPAGLTVEVKTPQNGLQAAGALAASNLKDATVVLPEGVTVNPGQAAGLAACQPSEDGVGSLGAAACPNASEVGTDEINTPLLTHALKGNVYVLQSNPPDLKLLVTASGEGVNLKLVGDVHLDETTGRLTTTFAESPELPFTTFRLSFAGGARAALVTPSVCGHYMSSSDFTPWSTPSIADASPSSEFVISSGSGGSSCAAPQFAPTLTAGSTTDQAGGFTDFSLLLTRGDGQQRIEKLQFEAPKGLVGMLSTVPLCEEPLAATGRCPAASQIGHTIVTAGPGPYPLVIPEPGKAPAPIYLTSGYKGAPYGLSIVVPVLAGPFNLGTVMVRASIAVDPHTAQLTITTNPLPSILDGVPTDLRTINAVIDKPGFMINPTNCEAQSFSGTATSTEGTTAAISSPFGMGSCRSLKFEPKFAVSIAGHASKDLGSGLTAKLTYPNVAQGSDADIAKVKVDLPVQLPSQLKTLQKACVAAVFEANPANCPPESIVGHATVYTSLLPVPLKGPAYFVSHAGAEFPSLTLVLQGYGVTVDLVGSTFISKAGITSTTFNNAPDVPFSSFELVLPQGKYAALGVNLPAKDGYDYCGQTLSMPTAFVGQNGAEIHTSTPISVEGCSNILSIKSMVEKQTVTVTVYAPAAGKITASGKGLTTGSRSAKGQENVTFTLKQKTGGRLSTSIKVAFRPSHGRKQTKVAKVKFRK